MRDERTTNYYAILELSPGASDAEIKRAWHEHMQVWHPDRFVHSPTLHRKAEARTQLINQAYQTLSDPAARARYDAGRQHPSSPTPPPRPSPTPRPQAAPRPRQELRGPQTMLNVTRFSHPKIMVPAIHMLVDSREHLPYEFKGLVRIGSNQHIPVDIRLICATNMPIYDMVRDKTFRQDLLYRINTVEIHLPHLRALLVAIDCGHG